MTDPETRQSRKDSYYLGIAEAAAANATCVRRTYGAIIVKNDEVVATGYNGSPRGCINCTDTGCIREQLGILKGDNYNLCASVHAEMNAMLSASRNEMIGATLYIVGMNAIPELIEESVYADPTPCLLCHRMIVNSGISRVVGRVPVKEEGHISTSVDKELDMSAGVFMQRLNDLYERTLAAMDNDITTMIGYATKQQSLGADTPELREMIRKYESSRDQVKNAYTVLKERQAVIRAAMTEHRSLREQAAVIQELTAIAKKYNIPFTTATQDSIHPPDTLKVAGTVGGYPKMVPTEDGGKAWGERISS